MQKLLRNQMTSDPTCESSDRLAPHQARLARPGITEIRIRGRTVQAPSILIKGITFVVTGGWLKVATVMDEQLMQGHPLREPGPFVESLRNNRMADVFTFAQTVMDVTRRHDYSMEWDNAAVIPITTYQDWWEKRLPQESRKNIRRAAKRGLEVRVVPFDDDLVKGIQRIYCETPVRQGRSFWHYGKPFDVVKMENATYLDRSEFVAAYLKEELVGFIKIIYVDRIATLIQIISKNTHQDKRPMNALLASAVDLCAKKGLSFLVYGKYVYDGNRSSTLTEFNRRNGFEELRFPRYFVPLTPKGKVAVALRLYRGVRGLLGGPTTRMLLDLRARFYRSRELRNPEQGAPSGFSD